jgi:hypothetical protein
VMCVSDLGCTACALDCALGVNPLPPTLTLVGVVTVVDGTRNTLGTHD